MADSSDNPQIENQNTDRKGGRTPVSAKRAEALALPEGSALPPPVPGMQHLVFSVHDCDVAVRADQVVGVERLEPITAVPNVAPWVRGVMNSRGTIVSVVDLRLFLDLEPREAGPGTRLLSLQWKEMIICLIVDSIHEMAAISPSIVEPCLTMSGIPAWIARFATGQALLANNRQVVLLDVPHLLFSEKMHAYAL